MSRLRGVLAMLLFIPGFVLVAAGVCWVVFSLAGSALAKPPPSLDVALSGTLPGVVMLFVGVALLFASRAADGRARASAALRPGAGTGAAVSGRATPESRDGAAAAAWRC